MPAKSAVLFTDPIGRTAKIFHRHHDGGWTHETVQDIDAVLEANKEAQNHCDTRSASGDMRLVARVPSIFMQKWFDEDGVDFYNPDHQDAVTRKLNDPEYRWLRTDNSVL